MSIRVAFLGTGVALPEPDRGPTATLLRCGDHTSLVDAGSGALEKLARRGVTPVDLDALFLTHDHLDHFADVLPLLFSLRIPGYTRQKPLTIVCSPETLERIRRVQAAFDSWLVPPDGTVVFKVMQPGESAHIGPYEIDTCAVQHTAASIGFRFTDRSDGAVLAVPGDTGKTDAVIPLLSGASLAILECSVPDENQMETHLSPSHLAELASLAAVNAVAAVHRYPFVKALDVGALIASSYSGVIHVPNDGDELLVNHDGVEEV